MKMKYILSVTVLISFLMLPACQKVQETTPPKHTAPTQEATKQIPQSQMQEPKDIQPAKETQPQQAEPQQIKKKAPTPLTTYEQWTFKGRHPEPSLISERDALKYLRILVKGDPDTIHWYKEHEKELPEGVNFWYQQDISTCVTTLGWVKNKEGYDLILQVLANKTDYPEALASAAKAAGMYGELKNGKWYGDNRAIPYLKNIINNKDPEVRLQAAGTLLSLGDGDIALPVLDEIIKAGISQSPWAIQKLFSPEETTQNGEKYTVIAYNHLFDERGKDILKKALNYPSDEVKSYAAIMLAYLGVEKEASEKVALKIINRLRNRTIKDYGYDPNKGVPTGPNEAAEYYKDGRTCTNAINTLGVLKSKKAIPILTDIQKNNTEWWYACGSRDASWALSLINKAEVSK